MHENDSYFFEETETPDEEKSWVNRIKQNAWKIIGIIFTLVIVGAAIAAYCCWPRFNEIKTNDHLPAMEYVNLPYIDRDSALALNKTYTDFLPFYLYNRDLPSLLNLNMLFGDLALILFVENYE